MLMNKKQQHQNTNRNTYFFNSQHFTVTPIFKEFE